MTYGSVTGVRTLARMRFDAVGSNSKRGSSRQNSNVFFFDTNLAKRSKYS